MSFLKDFPKKTSSPKKLLYHPSDQCPKKSKKMDYHAACNLSNVPTKRRKRHMFLRGKKNFSFCPTICALFFASSNCLILCRLPASGSASLLPRRVVLPELSSPKRACGSSVKESISFRVPDCDPEGRKTLDPENDVMEVFPEFPLACAISITLGVWEVSGGGEDGENKYFSNLFLLFCVSIHHPAVKAGRGPDWKRL